MNNNDAFYYNIIIHKFKKNMIENNIKKNIILNHSNYFFSLLILHYCIDIKQKLNIINNANTNIIDLIRNECILIIKNIQRIIIRNFGVFHDIFDSSNKYINDTITLDIFKPGNLINKITELKTFILNHLFTNSTINAIMTYITSIKETTTSIFDKIGATLNELKDFIKDKLNNYKESIYNNMKKIVNFIYNIIKIILETFIHKIESSISDIKIKFKEIIKKDMSILELVFLIYKNKEYKIQEVILKYIQEQIGNIDNEIITKIKELDEFDEIANSIYNKSKTFNIDKEEKEILIHCFYSQISQLNYLLKTSIQMSILDILELEPIKDSFLDKEIKSGYISYLSNDKTKIYYGECIRIKEKKCTIRNRNISKELKKTMKQEMNEAFQNIFYRSQEKDIKHIFPDLIEFYKDKNKDEFLEQLNILLSGNTIHYEIKLYVFLIFCPEDILYYSNKINQCKCTLYNNKKIWKKQNETFELFDNEILTNISIENEIIHIDNDYLYYIYNDKISIAKSFTHDKEKYVILINDIQFETIKETFFYTSSISKRILLEKGAFFCLDTDFIKKDIIIPDKNNTYLFLTKINLILPDNKIEGYINISDTNVNVANYNNVFEQMIKNMDSNIIKNILKLQTPPNEIKSMSKDIHTSQFFKDTFEYYNFFLSKHIRKYIPNKINSIINYKQKKESKYDNFFNIDEHIFKSIEYDFDFINTTLILDEYSIIYSNYKIQSHVYEILSTFLDDTRINKHSKYRIYNLFLNIILLIQKHHKGLSLFIVNIFLRKNNIHKEFIYYYIRTISNFHIIDIHDIILSDKYIINTDYVNYFMEYNKKQYKRFKSIEEDNNLTEYNKMRITKKTEVLDKNNKMSTYELERNTIVLMKKNEYPFIYKSNLYISIIHNLKEFIILRNQIEYTL